MLDRTSRVCASILLACGIAVSGQVAAQQTCKVVDDKGRVTYTQGPCLTGTRVQNRASSGVQVCDEACRQAAARSAVENRTVNADDCVFEYYKGDARGQQLAAEAKKECLLNKAMKESGATSYRRNTSAAKRWAAYDKQATEQVQRDEQNHLLRQQVIEQQRTNETLRQIQQGQPRPPVGCVRTGGKLVCY